MLANVINTVTRAVTYLENAAMAKRSTSAQRAAAAAAATTPKIEAPAPVAVEAPAAPAEQTKTYEEIMAEIEALQKTNTAPVVPQVGTQPAAEPVVTNNDDAPIDWSKVARSAETPFYDAATGQGPATADGPAAQRAEQPSEDAPKPNDNNPDTIKTYMKEVTKFGEAYGAGVNSLPSLALKTLQVMPRVPELQKTKASVILDAFNKASGKKSGIEHKSAAVQASKLNQILEIGKNGQIDAYSMMTRGIGLIKEMAAQDKSPMKGSTYENMVRIARAQKAVPQRELSDDEIRASLIPEKKEKTELEKLGDLFKALRKAHDYAPAAAKPGVEDAYHAMEDAIKAAGGTIPADDEDDAS